MESLLDCPCKGLFIFNFCNPLLNLLLSFELLLLLIIKAYIFGKRSGIEISEICIIVIIISSNIIFISGISIVKIVIFFNSITIVITGFILF